MIGIAVVGLGNAVEPHAKSLHDLRDRARVAWAVARSESRQTIAARNGWPFTIDLDRALGDPTVHAVLILTPANQHLPVAEAAVAAGKHVLCEKPLDASLQAAERMVALARAAGRALGVVLQMRFRPGSVRLRQALIEGELGTIAAATVAVPWWRPQAYYDQPGRGTRAQDGGGVLITQAIHAIDLFRWFVGVSAIDAGRTTQTPLHRMETEDYAAALLRLGNGAPGTLFATTALYPGRSECIEIIGTKGSARLEGGSLTLRFLDGREETLRDEGGSGGSANLMGFSHEPHRALISDFLDTIETGRDPAIPGEEALATQRVIAEIEARARSREADTSERVNLALKQH